MITKVKVHGMSCGHCSKAVKDAITAIGNDIVGVEVNLEDKIVTIESTVELSENVLKEIIEEEGYVFAGLL